MTAEENERALWDGMRPYIGNEYGLAGLMGNIQAESGYDPGIVERRSGIESRVYTAAVDVGLKTREEFAGDGYGYGLCQWTYREHKERLYDGAKEAGTSVGDLEYQIRFLKEDLGRFSGVLNRLRHCFGVKEASDEVMKRYLRPADQSEKAGEKRAGYGLEVFEKYGSREWEAEYMSAKSTIAARSAENRIGDPYVYGARGEECTPANRRKYLYTGYPEISEKCRVLSGSASTCAGCRYRGGHIYDCRGFTYRCLLDAGISIGGAGATSQWEEDGNWMDKGTTDDMPDAVCCLFKKVGSKMSHTGLHVGGGRIIHCSGEVKTDGISNRTWTHWAVPVGLYDEEELYEAGRIRAMSSLKRGSKGDAVRDLQVMLNALGYNCGAADGIYGSNTEKAVRKFQEKNGLTVDGIAGTLTRNALEEAYKRRGQDSGADPGEDESAGSDTPAPMALEERVARLEKAVFGE